MTLEIARRFINGEWKTSPLDEDGGGGSQPVQVAKVNVDSAALLAGTGTEIVATPGPGFALVPLAALIVSHFNSRPYGGASNSVIGIPEPQLVFEASKGSGLYSAVGPMQRYSDAVGAMIPNFDNFTAPADTPLVFYSAAMGGVGIVAATLQAGGSGYAPGDESLVTGGGGDAGGTLVIDTVAGGGVVTGFHLMAPGAGYNTASNPAATTPNTGAGDGLLTVNITVVGQGNGTATIICYYAIASIT